MSDTEYMPTINEVRADYVRDHTHAYDEYQGTLTLTAMQEFYGDQFDRTLAQHEAAIRRDQILKDAQIVESLSDRRAIGRYMDEATTALRAQIGDTNEAG